MLKETFLAPQGKVAHKWPLYLRAYEELFAPYRNQEIAIWRFGPNISVMLFRLSVLTWIFGAVGSASRMSAWS